MHGLKDAMADKIAKANRVQEQLLEDLDDKNHEELVKVDGKTTKKLNEERKTFAKKKKQVEQHLDVMKQELENIVQEIKQLEQDADYQTQDMGKVKEQFVVSTNVIVYCALFQGYYGF